VDNIKLIDKIMRYHRQYFDGESDCIEVWNQHYTVISDVHAIGESGRETIIPKEQAQKEAKEEKCWFCEYLRKLKKEVEHELG